MHTSNSCESGWYGHITGSELRRHRHRARQVTPPYTRAVIAPPADGNTNAAKTSDAAVEIPGRREQTRARRVRARLIGLRMGRCYSVLHMRVRCSSRMWFCWCYGRGIGYIVVYTAPSQRMVALPCMLCVEICNANVERIASADDSAAVPTDSVLVLACLPADRRFRRMVL